MCHRIRVCPREQIWFLQSCSDRTVRWWWLFKTQFQHCDSVEVPASEREKDHNLLDFRWSPTTISSRPVIAFTNELLPEPVTPINAMTTSETPTARSAVHVSGEVIREKWLLGRLSMLKLAKSSGLLNLCLCLAQNFMTTDGRIARL